MWHVAIIICGFFKDLEKYGTLSIEGLRAHVIDRLHPEKYTVDIFICQDTLQPVKDLGLKQLYEHRLRPFKSFNIKETHDQFERLHECYRQIENHQKYDFFIRTRPDLVIFEDIPNLHHLDNNYIYARLRAAVNVTGLLPDTFSFSSFCSQWECQPGSCSKNCTMYDDQFAIIPKGLSDAYFGFHNGSKEIINNNTCEWTKSFFNEGVFTRNVMMRGGRFIPFSYAVRLFMHVYHKDWPWPPYNDRTIATFNPYNYIHNC